MCLQRGNSFLSLQLRVAHCCVLRYRGMKCKNEGYYETRDNARRTDRATASSRLRSPASIVARRTITLIVRLGT